MSESVKSLLSGGAPAFPFGRVGDSIRGRILSSKAQPQTYMDDKDGHKKGDVVYWDNEKTQPKMMISLVLQTDVKEAYEVNAAGQATLVKSEDGKWSIYISGHKFTATQKVTDDLADGDIYGLTFVAWSDRPPQTRGHSPAKLYEAYYEKTPKSTPLGGPDKNDRPVAGSGNGASAPAGAAPATASSGTPYGPKPDYMPDQAWAVLTDEQKAGISPYVAPATVAAHGPKPDYMPEATWAILSAEQRAGISPPTAALARPDSIPEAVWAGMDEATKKAVVSSLSPV